MVSENILITSQLGIHLRPAGAMCNEAVKYKSDISFKYGASQRTPTSRWLSRWNYRNFTP